jgi:hypothetical protein
MSIRGYPPEYWLKLAVEAWERTLELNDPVARCEMQNFASRYERLAMLARHIASHGEARSWADTEVITIAG